MESIGNIELDNHTNSVNEQQNSNILKTFNNPIKPITLNNTQDDKNTESINSKVDSITSQQSNSKIDSKHTQSTTNIAINKNFFHKTQALLQDLADLDIFDSEILQKGIKIDLVQNNSLFFELYIKSELYLASVYAYILDERAFNKKDSPDLHFMRCEVIQKIPKDLLKVCVPTKNAFDYRVRSSGIDTRLFYEHPLRICPLCIAGLCELLSKKHNKVIHTNQIKEDEVMLLLFKNKLKNLVM